MQAATGPPGETWPPPAGPRAGRRRGARRPRHKPPMLGNLPLGNPPSKRLPPGWRGRIAQPPSFAPTPWRDHLGPDRYQTVELWAPGASYHKLVKTPRNDQAGHRERFPVNSVGCDLRLSGVCCRSESHSGSRRWKTPSHLLSEVN